MIRRVLAVAGVGLAALGGAGTAAADAPGGPRLAFVRVAEKPLAVELMTSDASAGQIEKVAGGGLRKRPLPSPFGAPAWSPDGPLIAFSGWPRKLRPEGRAKQIYLVAPDGTGLRPIPGTRGGIGPVFSPDAGTIAFAKVVRRLSEPTRFGARSVWKGATIWRVDLDGSGLRQLTQWRNGVEDFPSSFSPDGSLLAFSHADVWSDRIDAMARSLDGSGVRLLARDASRPVYSPDGSRIAFLGISDKSRRYCCIDGRPSAFTEASTDLYSIGADGSGVWRLTDTPDAVELSPSWDPGGERLVYSQLRQTFWRPTLSAYEGAIMQVNADGSCPTQVLSSGRHALYGAAAWQPGAGRQPDRIAC